MYRQYWFFPVCAPKFMSIGRGCDDNISRYRYRPDNSMQPLLTMLLNDIIMIINYYDLLWCKIRVSGMSGASATDTIAVEDSATGHCPLPIPLLTVPARHHDTPPSSSVSPWFFIHTLIDIVPSDDQNEMRWNVDGCCCHSLLWLIVACTPYSHPKIHRRDIPPYFNISPGVFNCTLVDI